MRLAINVSFFILCTLLFVLALVWQDGGFQEPTCEEYGTVLVIVNGDQRCVPWEQAPDLQDFPQP